MEIVKFHEVEQPLTRQDVQCVEEDVNGRFPESFIQHYLLFNGGYPEANWSEGQVFNCPIERFFSMKYGAATIEAELEKFREKSSISAGELSLPIVAKATLTTLI